MSEVGDQGWRDVGEVEMKVLSETVMTSRRKDGKHNLFLDSRPCMEPLDWLPPEVLKLVLIDGCADLCLEPLQQALYAGTASGGGAPLPGSATDPSLAPLGWSMASLVCSLHTTGHALVRRPCRGTSQSIFKVCLVDLFLSTDAMNQQSCAVQGFPALSVPPPFVCTHL